MIIQAVIYLFIGTQMAGWTWMMKSAGKLSDKKFMIFSAMMVAGQLGTIADALNFDNIVQESSWGVVGSQIFFMATTLFGAWQRWRQRNTTARST